MQDKAGIQTSLSLLVLDLENLRYPEGTWPGIKYI